MSIVVCEILYKTRIGVFAWGQILCISPKGLHADHFVDTRGRLHQGGVNLSRTF